MTLAVAHTALRLALRSMLADVTYPEVQTSRPWVEARLGEAAWSDTLTVQLTALALRWATTQGPRMAQTIRKALGEAWSEETTTETLSHQARQERVRTALYNSYGRTETMSIAEVRENIHEEVNTALTPLFAQTLDDVAETMKKDPYWFPHDQKRYDAAMRLVREGKVTCDRFGIYHVTGSKGTIYHCDKECPCYDGQHGKSKWCRHLIATAAHRKVMARLSALETEQMLFPQTPTVDERLATPAKEPAMPTATADRPIPDMTGKAPHVPQETSKPADAPGDAPSPERASGVAAPPPQGLLVPRPLPLRSITAIVADLSRPLPTSCVATKTAKSKAGQRSQIAYLHWQTVARLLDTYAPGWNGEVTRLEQQGQTVRVTYRLQIPCAEGLVWREATGEDDEWEPDEEMRYGNPSANAQANAFKRAAALLGCGQWLYDKPNDSTGKALADHFQQEKKAALIDLGKALVDKGMDRRHALAWLKTHAGVTTTDELPLPTIRMMQAYVAQKED